MRIFLIRHFLSNLQANPEIEFTIPGLKNADITLAPLGYQQSAETTDNLLEYLHSHSDFSQGKRKVVIICSPHTRTCETKDPIEAVLRANTDHFEVMESRTDARIREYDTGHLWGLREHERQQRFPEVFARWSATPENSLSIACPGGESIEDLKKRTDEFLAELKTRYADDTDVIVVSHDYPLRTMRMAFDNTKGAKWFRTVGCSGNGSVRLIEGKNGALEDKGYIHGGDMAHNNRRASNEDPKTKGASR